MRTEGETEADTGGVVPKNSRRRSAQGGAAAAEWGGIEESGCLLYSYSPMIPLLFDVGHPFEETIPANLSVKQAVVLVE